MTDRSEATERDTAAQRQGLSVPARCIPVPSSVSPEARAVLAAAAVNSLQWADYPAIDDDDGWQEYVRVADENMLAMLAPVAERLKPYEITSLRVDQVETYRVANAPGAGRVLLHMHGGALIAGGGRLCEIGAMMQASAMDALVYAPDYRMPPRFPFPAALDDCLAVYRHMIEMHAPEEIVVHGMSAGGNLAAALLLRVKEEGLPPPAGLILETPELDLTESGDSFETNAIIDIVLQRRLGPINRLYAGGADLAHPHLSPLFGDLSRFPRTLLTAGTRDMFLSNAARMHHRLRAAGVPAELLVYEAMPHGGFFGTPDDALVRQDIRRFADECWAGARRG